MLAVCAVLALASGAAIVQLSGQDSGQSQFLSRGLTMWLMKLLPIEDTVESLEQLNFILRKLAHLGLYFLLGLGLTGLALRQKKVPAALAVIVLCGLFALSDEFHQRFSFGRTPSGWDVLLDACGAAAGYVVFKLLRQSRRKEA